MTASAPRLALTHCCSTGHGRFAHSRIVKPGVCVTVRTTSDVSPPIENTLVTMGHNADCSSSNLDSLWTYDAKTGLIRHAYGLCLEASHQPSNFHPIVVNYQVANMNRAKLDKNRLKKCDPTNIHQQGTYQQKVSCTVKSTLL